MSERKDQARAKITAAYMFRIPLRPSAADLRLSPLGLLVSGYQIVVIGIFLP
jgi:hypothetical protein